jgi:hypothetical protein
MNSRITIYSIIRRKTEKFLREKGMLKTFDSCPFIMPKQRKKERQ